MSKTRKAIIIPCLANCIELYDFTLFPVLLPILAQIMFQGIGNSAIEIGYLTFAVSFLIVPFSAIFWGYYGDKYGKSRLLKYSMFIMAIPSLIIAFTPGYEVIGCAAAVILMLARILQGISASAEVLGSKIYAINSLEEKQHIFASSFISAFGAIGVTFAVLMGYFASEIEYLWRVAFLLGSSIFILVMFMRIKDTQEKEKKNITLASVMKVISVHKNQAIYTFTLSAVLGLLSYTLHSFMISYAVEKLGSLSQGYMMLAKALLCTVFSAVVFGVISLKIAFNMQRVVRILLIVFSVITVPLFYYLHAEHGIMLVTFIMSILLGIYASVSGVLVIRSFPVASRFRGALLVNAFGVAIFGGSAPYILKVLSNTSILYSGVYLTIMFFIALVIAFKYDSSPLH